MWICGTRRGRIQLKPSGTSGLCLGITRHPCDKTHALCYDNQALLKTVKIDPRLPTTKLICSNSHSGAATLSALMMLLRFSFASASFTSRNPSSLSVDRLNLKYIRSSESHWLRPLPDACPRNDLRRKTLDRGCTVLFDFFWQVLSPLHPVHSPPALPCCRFSETLLVTTACSCYFLCQAWQTWACFLAFVQRACCHTGASRWSGGQP